MLFKPQDEVHTGMSSCVNVEQKKLYYNELGQDLMKKCIFYELLNNLSSYPNEESALLSMRQTLMENIYSTWNEDTNDQNHLPHPEFFRLASFRDDALKVTAFAGFLSLTTYKIICIMWNYFMTSVEIVKNYKFKIRTCMFNNLPIPVNLAQFSITEHLKNCLSTYHIHASWLTFSSKNLTQDGNDVFLKIFKDKIVTAEKFSKDWKDILASEIKTSTDLLANGDDKKKIFDIVIEIWKDTRHQNSDIMLSQLLSLLDITPTSMFSEYSEITHKLK
jgi:hypothetical protein